MVSDIVYNNNTAMSKPKILYIYDAICGWCFGFSPVMARFSDEYANKVDIAVVSGGLKLGDGVGTISEIAAFLKDAYLDVEAKTGVKFGEAFVNGPLEDGSMVLNSLPPAIALSIIKERYPEKALEFAGMLHKMIYVDGVGPENYAAYGQYAATLGYDEAEFYAKMLNPVYFEMAQRDFAYAKSLGVRSYPTLLIEKGGKMEVLASGYISYERLATLVDSKL
ncbi:putative protein-disulfide isomerase [Williamwhitmania taraxaci]|uniref:DSBA-like thioredoxin domain-containing protein n=2 Tax=Williamwhitmania taraxaci TaxID=1640674 RepID=A0A1G6H640_9BACT|nr:putative protein-disulfide isomerase [Williamwhitmania taraxaci]